MPGCSERWGGTNSTSAAGRRRAGTWSRLPGSIPAQAQCADQLGQRVAQHPPLPRGRAGPMITRSSSRPRTWLVRADRATVALAQGDLSRRAGRDQRCAQGGGPHRARRVRGELPGPHVGAGRGPAAAPAAAHAERVRRRPGEMGHRARPDLCPPGQHGEGARLRRLGPAGASRAASGISPGRAASRTPRARAGLLGTEGGRRSGRASAAWRSCRSDRDAYLGPYIQHQLARIYLLVGEPEKALDQLEPLLKIPYNLSPGWLKIDPNFAPLRGNPRFERLVNGS